jgi:hypothetical protein
MKDQVIASLFDDPMVVDDRNVLPEELRAELGGIQHFANVGHLVLRHSTPRSASPAVGRERGLERLDLRTWHDSIRSEHAPSRSAGLRRTSACPAVSSRKGTVERKAVMAQARIRRGAGTTALRAYLRCAMSARYSA